MKGYKNYKLNKGNKYNKYENIEIKSFYDADDVDDLIGNKLEEFNNDDSSLVIYGKRDLINTLFLNMISEGYDFGYINFDKMDDLDKGKIYLMTVTGDCRINIEPAYSSDKKIMRHDADIAIIFTDDCTQDIIDYCIDNDMKVILFDFEDDNGYCDEENCEDCCGCDSCSGCKGCNDRNNCENYEENLNSYESASTTVTVSKTKNGTPNGFIKSWDNNDGNTFSSTTYSFYSDDLGLLGEVAEEFGVKL